MAFPARTGEHSGVEYPELAARTRRFTYGAPRAVTVSGDGGRVVFVRSSGPTDPVDALWIFDVDQGVERLIADPATLLGDATDLPPAERALRERLRLSAAGIGSYALDGPGRRATFTVGGQLFVADLHHQPTGTADGAGDGERDATGAGAETETETRAETGAVVRAVATAGPAVDPRLDPSGRRIAYVTGGALHVIDLAADGGPTDVVLAAEDGVTWGMAEFIGAEEFRRFRGHWWSPDSTTVLAARVDESRVRRWHLQDPSAPENPPHTVAYPAAGTDNAQVSLHLLDLDGGWVDVHWDRETYPYLTAVSWDEHGPLITVLRRLQHHGLVMAVNPRTGETQVHAELTDPRWFESVPGTPVQLRDGRVVVGGELTNDGNDARCLFADGSLLTPPHLYVRRLAGRLNPGTGEELVIEASAGEPSEQHVYLVAADASPGAAQARRLTSGQGWHQASAAGGTLVISALSLEHAGWQTTVYRGGAPVGEITSLAAAPPSAPRPVLERVTDRRLPTGVLYPRSHVAGRRLPVLVDIYGGPGHQEVVAMRSRWLERQWWADQGYAVVVVDNRGTPGVAPTFEKVIHRRIADVVLTDQVDALHALADKHPDLDLGRVAIRGWSFGGFLSALAVLRRPDVYHVAVSGAPCTDWTLYDTAYTERYLGLPADGPEIYEHHSLVELAAQPPATPADARPVLLVHGLVDDNVVAAHTLRLSAAMLRAGRPHAMIPLTGATHMPAGGLSERLLRVELDFVGRNLPQPS